MNDNCPRCDVQDLVSAGDDIKKARKLVENNQISVQELIDSEIVVECPECFAEVSIAEDDCPICRARLF